MSSISSGTTLTTALVQTADTSGVLQLQTNGTTTAVTIDTNQNFGLGVTPSAWGSPLIGALQVGNASIAKNSGGSTLYLNSNAYYDGTNWRYINTGYSAKYTVNNNSGIHLWEIAPSGTAGNAITFTQAMTLDASNRLMVNTTSATTNSVFQVSSNGIKQSFQVFNNDNVQLYSLGTGTVTCSSGVLSYTSDERLKIADGVFSGGLEAVQNIIPQYFYWKGEDGQQDPNRPRELGFFAQNIQATCGEETAPNPHREDLHMGIHDRGVMAVLVSAIQELSTQVTTLQTQVTALKG